MFSFKPNFRIQKVETRPAAIEPLEARAYFSATPATATLTVPGPIPSSAISGVAVNEKIGVNIANNDVVKAGGRATIALFLSTDQTLSSDDIQVQTPTKEGLNIAPGRNHTFPIHVKAFPQNLNGTYYIIAEVEGAGVNTTSASSTATIAVEQAVIDLAGTVTKAPLNGNAGKHIAVSVRVTNDGNVLAGKSVTVGFSLSGLSDGTAPVALGSLTKPLHLKPGASTILHFSVPLALGVPTGNEYVAADFDPENLFLDPNLANNTNVLLQPVVIR